MIEIPWLMTWSMSNNNGIRNTYKSYWGFPININDMVEYKVVCITVNRTILTTSNRKKAESRAEKHRALSGHIVSVFEIEDDVEATGKELLSGEIEEAQIIDLDPQIPEEDHE